MWFLATDKLVPSRDLQDHLAFIENLLYPEPGDRHQIPESGDPHQIVALRELLARTHSRAHVTCFWRGDPGEPAPQTPASFKSAIAPLAADIETDFATGRQSS